MAMSARSYNPTFARSSIFDPTPGMRSPRLEPAGKRRDQTTSEMFGTWEEKECRSQPKTFVPREDNRTARDRMLQSMNSEVLPCTTYAPIQDHPGRMCPEARPPLFNDEGYDRVSANARRQMELQSVLFGRQPVADPGQLCSPSKRSIPTDMSWHAHNEVPPAELEVQHVQRAFQEKCSSLFDHQSPQTLEGHLENERRFREEEREADAARRANPYYSDLNGRSAYSDAGSGVQRPLHRARQQEERHVVHQDWTDSKTELLGRTDRPEHAHLRKAEELHHSRVFQQQPSHGWEASTERVKPMTYDNSDKVRSAFGRSSREIHNAHMRSSCNADDSFSAASGTAQWQVANLHVSGLSRDADDRFVRKLCQGLDLHIVKAAADMDPVRNMCQGRAQVTVRYNPECQSLNGLLQRFAASNLKVET